MNSKSETTSILKNATGRTIEKISPVKFFFRGKVDSDDTPLQIQLKDDEVLFFDAGGDGESLKVKVDAWVDPFTTPISEENQEYLESHGKWEIVDVSGDDFFGKIIGEKITEIEPVYGHAGKLVGATLILPTARLNIVVEWDELRVRWG